MIAMFNYIDGISMTKRQAQAMSHPGRCDDDVKEGMQIPAIKRQLKKIDPEKLRKELREYGAWDETDLIDHNANLMRILWIAAGNIVEEN